MRFLGQNRSLFGYVRRNPKEFLCHLKQEGVRTVVDVRLRPDRARTEAYTRVKSPEKGIQKVLADAAVDYLHLRSDRYFGHSTGGRQQTQRADGCAAPVWFTLGFQLTESSAFHYSPSAFSTNSNGSWVSISGRMQARRSLSQTLSALSSAGHLPWL